MDYAEVREIARRLQRKLVPGEELSPIQLTVMIEQDLGFVGHEAVSGFNALNHLVVHGCLEQLPSKMYCWLGEPGSQKRALLERE